MGIVEGGSLRAQGGAGQVMPPLIEALRRLLGERCTIITEDGLRIADVGRAVHVIDRFGRARRKLIRRTQEHTPIPLLRWLTGTYDVYHYIGLSLRPRVPYRRLIISVHDLGGARWPDEEPCATWGGAVLRRASRVVTVSAFSKAELCGHYGITEERVAVIYNGCDHRRYHPRPEAADDRVLATINRRRDAYILCAGGITRRKNIRRLLHAFALFQRATASPQHLLLTGVDPRSQVGAAYRALSRELGIAGNVTLPGYLPDEVMPALYRAADAVVVPSLYEGFGLPVVQAMACGTPVLCSDASSLPEVAGDGALLVDATSVEALATGLARITADGRLRAGLRERGLVRAATFTWERCAEETVAIYEDVASLHLGGGRADGGVRAL